MKLFREEELEALLAKVYEQGQVDQRALSQLSKWGNGFKYVQKRREQLRAVSLKSFMEQV